MAPSLLASHGARQHQSQAPLHAQPCALRTAAGTQRSARRAPPIAPIIQHHPRAALTRQSGAATSFEFETNLLQFGIAYRGAAACFMDNNVLQYSLK